MRAVTYDETARQAAYLSSVLSINGPYEGLFPLWQGYNDLSLMQQKHKFSFSSVDLMKLDSSLLFRRNNNVLTQIFLNCLLILPFLLFCVDSVRDAVGRKVKLSLRKRVKLEIKGDKMENRVMLSLAVLFLLSGVLWESSAEDIIPTYDYQDPYTGETFKCNKCPPGTHIAAHCTATTPTKCEPCRNDRFTELWNYLPRCLYCSICTQKQEVETECSPVRNRVCRCKEGYYWVDDFCVSHSQCGPGYGVQARGTSQKDTVCEKCPSGYFSESSSALDSCVKHQECANGEQVLLPGSAVEDTLCGSCEDLANEGETFRTFLSAFFIKNLKRVRQQKRFVSRIICKSDQESCEDDVYLCQNGGLLLDQIRAWVAHIPVKKLQHLPTELKDAHLISIAEKLNKRLDDIKHFPNCSTIV